MRNVLSTYQQHQGQQGDVTFFDVVKKPIFFLKKNMVAIGELVAMHSM